MENEGWALASRLLTTIIFCLTNNIVIVPVVIIVIGMEGFLLFVPANNVFLGVRVVRTVECWGIIVVMVVMISLNCCHSQSFIFNCCRNQSFIFNCCHSQSFIFLLELLVELSGLLSVGA